MSIDGYKKVAAEICDTYGCEKVAITLRKSYSASRNGLSGLIYDGKTGEVLDKMNLGGNVEASPAVYKDTLVVGTRTQKIFGIKLQ